MALQGINMVFSNVFGISSVVNFMDFLMWKALDMAVWSSQKARQQNLFVMLTVLEEI